MTEIKIAYAFDDEDNLIGIAEAERGQKVFCPLCKNPVIVRKGNIRIHHFAHKVSDICTQETITHKVAKLLIQKTIEDWKKGRTQAPVFLRSCQYCYSREAQPIPKKVERADLEVRLADGFIVDVALMAENVPIAAIEIRVTHAVSEEKEEGLSIPYIEVDGFEVIENPRNLIPETDTFNPFTCKECKQRLNKFIQKAKRIAEATKIQLPDSYYRYGITKCWSCKKKILVFAWPGQAELGSAKPVEKPKPHTIQYRKSKLADKEYWVNSCPYCSMIQGDVFLYHKYFSPFFNFECGKNNPSDYYTDMMHLSNYDETRFLYYP